MVHTSEGVWLWGARTSYTVQCTSHAKDIRTMKLLCTVLSLNYIYTCVSSNKTHKFVHTTHTVGNSVGELLAVQMVCGVNSCWSFKESTGSCTTCVVHKCVHHYRSELRSSLQCVRRCTSHSAHQRHRGVVCACPALLHPYTVSRQVNWVICQCPAVFPHALRIQLHTKVYLSTMRLSRS